MRVGLLIYGSLDTVSGGYLYDRKLVDFLRSHRHTVEIFSIPWRSYPAHLTDNFHPGLYQKLANAQVDFLIEDELNHPSLFLLNRRLRAAGVGYPRIGLVHHLRSSENHPKLPARVYGWVEKRYLQTLDGFIFNSQTTLEAVRRHMGWTTIPKPHVIALPAGDRFKHKGLLPSAIQARAQQPGPLRVLFLGNVIPRKGLHTLLDAIHQAPDVYLTVAGSVDTDKAYFSSIQKQVARLSLANRVRFLGAVGEDAAADQLLQNHVLAVPSSYEGFGIVYLEAMGAGLPAIGTTRGGAAEMIQHQVSGFLVESGDAAALGAFLNRLNQNRNLLAKMSMAAQTRFAEFPGWNESMAKIVDFLGSNWAK